jgi:hypothetical protein
MSGVTSLPNAFLPNKKAADPYQEPAATSIATTGQPPASHERAARSIARRVLARSTGADRMARYKVNPARRAARTVRGASCERDTRLRHAEGAGGPLMPCSIGRATCVPARLGSPYGHSAEPQWRNLWDAPGSNQVKTAGLDIARGDAPSIVGRRFVYALEPDSGRLAPQRTHLYGPPACPPRLHGTSVPLPGSARSCT